jgi:hypothetical protein
MKHENRYICTGTNSPRNVEAPPDRHALIAEALGFED